jgi:hypothetical protein
MSPIIPTVSVPPVFGPWGWAGKVLELPAQPAATAAITATAPRFDTNRFTATPINPWPIARD